MTTNGSVQTGTAITSSQPIFLPPTGRCRTYTPGVLIVAGYLRVTDRDRYLEACREVVEQAREAPGCLDFTLGADLVEPDRVNVYERWTNRAAVEVFRGEGTSGELDVQITAADVREFDCTGEVPL